MSNMYDAMSTLFTYAVSTLPDNELNALSEMTERAEDEARSLSRVCEEIACLVAEDGLPNPDGSPRPRAGNFQSSQSVFNLLCSLSHRLDTIAAMAHVGDQARFHAHERELAKLKGGGAA